MIVGAFLFALEREMAPFRRSFAQVERRPEGRSPTWDCTGSRGTFRLTRSGMGAAAVRAACAEILAQRPPYLILAGFSGGLAPDLPVGHLVNATAVHTLAGASRPCTLTLSCPQALAGPILTTEQIVSTVEAKRYLYEQTGALAVDLESAIVAECCAVAGVPFACLRVISDAEGEALPPELSRITQGESIRPLRLLSALVCRPGLLRDLLRLARATAKAGAELSRALQAVVNS